MNYSIIIPVRNEQTNVKPLYERLVKVMEGLRQTYEIIFVDDKSIDDTFLELSSLPNVTIVGLKIQAGQSAALYAGLKHSQGETVITMDGDLEHQPEDIIQLLNKLHDGWDMVVGWRQDRWANQWFSRKLSSAIANWLIRKVTKVQLHDYGCTFRVFKRQIISDFNLQYDLHRIIPAQAALAGYKVTEIPINFQPRINGQSKYGWGRVPQVIMDIIGWYFRSRFVKRALHFFGGWGLIMWLVSLAALVWATILRLGYGIHFNRTPLPIFVAMFFLGGIQLIMIGLLGDLIVNSRSPEQKEKIFYQIDKVIKT